jgi:hypothetical protein
MTGTIDIDAVVKKYKKNCVRMFIGFFGFSADGGKFFVNKQFDNKNFCAVKYYKTGGETVLGLFRRKYDAINFGIELGLTKVDAPR